MELSYKMLTAQEVALARNPDIQSERSAPDTDVPRRIDMYFASRVRSKERCDSDWRSPEEVLAKKYEELWMSECQTLDNAKKLYYVYGICYKIGGTPSDIMSRRCCIELRIDGQNNTVETRGLKQFVVDHRNGIEYELIDGFYSKILME